MSVDHLISPFRDKRIILALSNEIKKLASKLTKKLVIMEVCGGHTHSIMKYGLLDLMPKNLEFAHGPGCPVCVMPRARLDEAYELASMKDSIVLSLGDMMRVPGSYGSLIQARGKGLDARFLYSPMQALEIAKENPHKKVIYIAIGFETTTPMTASVLLNAKKEKLKNLFFHINHILVPPSVSAILEDKACQINALLAPSHVSVISGAQIYTPLVDRFKLPIIVSGFEPVDILESVLMLTKQALNKEAKLEIQYKRAVSYWGNTKAQELVNACMGVRENFEWRGLGNIKRSALKLKEAFASYDAEKVFKAYLSHKTSKENKACKCGEILKGIAKPLDCSLFATTCTPQNPIGSCMVSSEGACAAYYRYKRV
ncbi:hydrogenase formation protein HypD [Helicobacter pylori]|uniref:Hydrogenase expression/formation protein HypD n=1 Tax=Helicobacter pylori Hp H-34 TaxID=992069 RepID=J0PCL2_HELPX|nr:hydrogenase formation protein HypD [Helicobacter pylori]EJB96317.1 hydrogenase expression/formation protein HypD [Helicobacter pylori Hp H-34]